MPIYKNVILPFLYIRLKFVSHVSGNGIREQDLKKILGLRSDEVNRKLEKST
jgi:hypothetical protein